MRIRRSLLSLFVCLPLAGALASAQLPPSSDAPPVSHAPAPAQDEGQSVATFKLRVNLVDVFFNVKNKSGELMPHLSQSDCAIMEDKAPQTWKSFSAQTDLPLTLGILLDTSGSQEHVLPLEQQAGSHFLEQVLRKKDEAFLLSFDVDVDLLQDFTSEPRRLSRALDKAQINTAGGNGAAGVPGIGQGPVPTIGQPKGTLLYDAIYLAATEKLNQEAGRKAMIILTDGDDQGSKTKIGEAISQAQRSNVVIYVILIADPGFYGGFGYSGYSAAKRLSEETGGRMINVGNNGKKLEDAFQQIQDELRSQYIGTYSPTDARMDGTFRHISVSCGEGMRVQVRKGYYAPKPEDQDK